MLVFVDESGDPGFKFASGSSIFFIVVAAIFPDSFSADACDRSIEELRRTLRLPLHYEFHFSHCSDRVRREFFKKVVTDQFQYHGFVLNKPRLYGNRFNDKQGFYDFTVGLVCENAGPLLRDAIVVIDKCGDREFKQKLAKSLKARMTDGDGNCRLKKVRMESSHNNNRRHALWGSRKEFCLNRCKRWRVAEDSFEARRTGTVLAKMTPADLSLAERRP